MQNFEARVRRELPRLLADLFQVSDDDLEVEPAPKSPAGDFDLVIKLAATDYAYIFLVAARASGAAAPVSQGIDCLRVLTTKRRMDVYQLPLLVVPFMGDVGRRLCKEAEVSWVDLSGNASIAVPPLLRILVEGKPNRFKKAGRPANPFAPKSSRVARCLLSDPTRSVTQRQISEETDISEGFVSHIVHALIDQGLVVREEEGSLRVPDPALLLDAWSERHDFSKHRIVEAHVLARAPELLLETLPPLLQTKGTWDYAFTGLAGAWLCAPFASYQLTTLYVQDRENPHADEDDLGAVLEDLSFRHHARAPNLWVVFPRDEGVFQFAGEEGERGVRCVHPVQVYLDLAAHPERASEAAAELRKQRLNWSARG